MTISWLWLCASLALGQNADDWPHPRGPDFAVRADATKLAKSWPAEGPPRLWSRELGQGYSGFAIVDGLVYTQFQQLGGQVLLCLDMATGDERWRFRYDSAWQRAGAYPGPYASPTVADGHVYYASPSGIVGCVDARDGSPVWSRNLAREFRATGAGFGFACSPLVEDRLVIFPVGGKGASIVALRADDGSTAWQVGDDPASYCPAMAITWRGRRLVVGYLRNAVVLHDLKSGQFLARHVLSTDYDEHSSWPIYREPHLFIASPFKFGAKRLRLDAAEDGSPILRTDWTSKDLSNDVLSSVLHEDSLYGFDLREMQAKIHRTSRGVFRCLDFETGKVRWSAEEVGHASVIVADGKLVLLNDVGVLRLAPAAPDGYQELASHQAFANGPCWTPPIVWRGKLLVRGPDEMICFDLGAAAKATASRRAPVVGRSNWDWIWLIGREPEFPNDAPTLRELATWFAIGLAICAVAMLAESWRGDPSLWMLLLGIAATPALGWSLERFTWTLPVALFAGFRLVMRTIIHVESRTPKPRWRSRLAVVLFVVGCYGYYLLCQRLGLMLAWCFLIGFPAAWPVFAYGRQRRNWLELPIGFALYFWSCAAFILSK